MKNRYKISDLAKMFGISKQTLIFYHKKNILVPNFIDEDNGYRYYSGSQIWDLYFILTLKEAGFSLEEIKKYTENKNIKNSISFLEEKVCDIDKKIEILKRSREKIRDKIDILEEIDKKVNEKIKIIKKDELNVYFLNLGEKADDEKIALGYEKVKKIAEKNGINRIVYVSTVNLEKDIYLSSVPVTKVGFLIPKDMKIDNSIKIKKKEYVYLKYRATYDKLYLAYKSMLEYIKEKKIDIENYSLELSPEVIIPMEDGFGGVIEIFIPIKKFEK
nr:MerR family transcriptional regulator [uncultured Cetobacterium sp.]